KQLRAADNGVGHAAAGLAHGSRKPGKKAPAYGGSAVVDQVAENKKERRNGDHGANTGHREHESAHEFPPAQTRAHACPIPLPRCEVTTISRRAKPFRIKVSRKRTRPSSISDCV